VRLGAILLANSAEMTNNGLLYLMGGGWDTLNVPPGSPITYQGSLVLRVLADRAECDRQHPVDIRLDGEDGQLVFRVQSEIRPVIPEGYPVGWEVPYSLVVQLGGPLPRFGLYRFTVLIDNALIAIAPIRVLEQALPGAPRVVEVERPPEE
jgi:hypothetical protein